MGSGEYAKDECGKGALAEVTGTQDQPLIPTELSASTTRVNQRGEPFDSYTEERYLTYTEDGEAIWSDWIEIAHSSDNFYLEYAPETVDGGVMDGPEGGGGNEGSSVPNPGGGSGGGSGGGGGYDDSPSFKSLADYVKKRVGRTVESVTNYTRASAPKAYNGDVVGVPINRLLKSRASDNHWYVYFPHFTRAGDYYEHLNQGRGAGNGKRPKNDGTNYNSGEPIRVGDILSFKSGSSIKYIGIVVEEGKCVCGSRFNSSYGDNVKFVEKTIDEIKTLTNTDDYYITRFKYGDKY